MTALRIGIDVPRAGFSGGVERYAHDLAVDLRARGHRVTLLHGRERGREEARYREGFDEACLRDEVDPARLDVAYVQRASSRDELAPYGDLPLRVASHDHDHTCVRSHRYLPLDPSSLRGGAPRACHRRPGADCAFRGCGVVRDRGGGWPWQLRSPWRLRQRVRALAGRAPFIACSAYVADRLVEAGVPPHRVDVVHPIPAETPRAVVPRPEGRSLLFVGQLLRGKGVEVAIDALRHLPGATLRVVGDGPSRPALERRAAAFADRVRFEGFCPPAEVDRFYDEASLVLVPSAWPEPFGMVGIEAMRRARPVVAAAHGGIPEWLDGRGARGFPPGDPHRLAQAIEGALADPAAGDHALTASRRFSRRAMVDRIEDHLRAAAGRG